MKLLSMNCMLPLKPTILAIALLGLQHSPATWGAESNHPARVNTRSARTEYSNARTSVPQRETYYADQLYEQGAANRQPARHGEPPAEHIHRTVDSHCNSDAVADMITAWGDAWAKQDLEAYFSYYLPNFKGDYRDPVQWRKTRSRAIESAGKIDLRLSDIQIDVLKNCDAVVTFKQDYRSDLSSDVGVKELGMRLIDGQWWIQQETLTRRGMPDMWRATAHEPASQTAADRSANALAAAPAPRHTKNAWYTQAPHATTARPAAEPAESAVAARTASQIVKVVPDSRTSPGSARVTWVGDGVELVRNFALAAGVDFGGVEGNARRVPVNVAFADMPLQQALETVGEALGDDVDLIVRPTEYLVRFK